MHCGLQDATETQLYSNEYIITGTASCHCLSTLICLYWFKYALDQSTTYPKVDPNGVRTNDLQSDYDSTFHVTETSVLTTRPSVTSGLLRLRHQDTYCY